MPLMVERLKDAATFRHQLFLLSFAIRQNAQWSTMCHPRFIDQQVSYVERCKCHAVMLSVLDAESILLSACVVECESIYPSSPALTPSSLRYVVALSQRQLFSAATPTLIHSPVLLRSSSRALHTNITIITSVSLYNRGNMDERSIYVSGQVVVAVTCNSIWTEFVRLGNALHFFSFAQCEYTVYGHTAHIQPATTATKQNSTLIIFDIRIRISCLYSHTFTYVRRLCWNDEWCRKKNST